MAVQSNEAEAGMSIVVPSEQSGSKLLEFVASLFVNESKTSLRRLIASGRVRLNGAAATTGRAVWTGDVVSVPAGLAATPPPAQTLPIEVLWEDADHLCVNKPAGHPVLPGRAGEGADFFRSLVALLNRDAPPGGPYVRPHVVHRLDRGTSGVLLVAKTVEAGRSLGRQFEARQVQKAYLAIVEGALPRSELTLDIPLAQMRGSSLKMTPNEQRGKPARTELAIEERFGHFSLLCVRPLTGRQHQIRVHLAAIGYPLAVDGLYGRRAELTGRDFNAIVGTQAACPGDLLLSRCPLHAASIRYGQPRTGEPMAHKAPLPDDLEELLDLLRRTDPHN